MTAKHFGGEEFVDGLARTGDAMVGFLDVGIKCVADYLAEGKSDDGAVVAAQNSALEASTLKHSERS